MLCETNNFFILFNTHFSLVGERVKKLSKVFYMIPAPSLKLKAVVSLTGSKNYL